MHQENILFLGFDTENFDNFNDIFNGDKRLVRIGVKVYEKMVLFVPTFDTKVTEYLCSGWDFFIFRQISTF